MALDRTWYNSLVDDDGSGLTGSVWDKADVNSLMNAIDAELARIDGAWAAYTPILEAENASLTAAIATVRYHMTGKTVDFRYTLEGGSLSGPAGWLRINLPTYVYNWGSALVMAPAYYYIGAAGGTGEWGTLELTSDGPYGLFRRTGGQTFPAGGSLYVRGQATFEGR